MNKSLVIDIETTAQPDERLVEIMPEFEAPSNYKDPLKIAANKQEQFDKWKDDAALHAERGQVLCIGLWQSEVTEPQIFEGDETKMIAATFGYIQESWSNRVIVGHNLFGFDLPFLVRRAWALGVPVPLPALFLHSLRAYYPPDEIFDTMLAWRLGNREERISLDMLAFHLGVGRTVGSGKDFGKTYETDRPSAIEHLVTDLKLTKACYERMTR